MRALAWVLLAWVLQARSHESNPTRPGSWVGTGSTTATPGNTNQRGWHSIGRHRLRCQRTLPTSAQCKSQGPV